MHFLRIFFTKIAKKGKILPASDDVASAPRWRADVARGTTARVRRGAEATWQSRGWPTRGARGAQGATTWQEATHVHTDARVGRHVAAGGSAGEVPTG